MNKYKNAERLAKEVTKTGYEMAYIMGNTEKVIDVFKELKNQAGGQNLSFLQIDINSQMIMLKNWEILLREPILLGFLL